MPAQEAVERVHCPLLWRRPALSGSYGFLVASTLARQGLRGYSAEFRPSGRLLATGPNVLDYLRAFVGCLASARRNEPLGPHPVCRHHLGVVSGRRLLFRAPLGDIGRPLRRRRRGLCLSCAKIFCSARVGAHMVLCHQPCSGSNALEGSFILGSGCCHEKTPFCHNARRISFAGDIPICQRPQGCVLRRPELKAR